MTMNTTMTMTEIYNTLKWNATQDHHTAAYRKLVGMDDPTRYGKFRGLGCYTQAENLSIGSRAVDFWISDEADKVKYGLDTLARLTGCSLTERVALDGIYKRACDALLGVGVPKEVSEAQRSTEAAFASCGGSIAI